MSLRAFRLASRPDLAIHSAVWLDCDTRATHALQKPID